MNKVIEKSCEDMSELDDGSVDLIVTSPPYNVGMEYEHDLEWSDYFGFLRRVWAECYRVLCVGGRICVNIAGVARQPYTPLHAYINVDLADVGFLMRGELIWYKGGVARGKTAWGSWRSPSNPVLRDEHEYILVHSKDSFGRKVEGGEPTISKEEFLEYTRSVWHIAPESAKRVGHPAPFPLELPERLIKLYTYKGDVVLDPFAGSGTTMLAAERLGRRWVGYETDAEYIKIFNKRLTGSENQTSMFL